MKKAYLHLRVKAKHGRLAQLVRAPEFQSGRIPRALAALAVSFGLLLLLLAVLHVQRLGILQVPQSDSLCLILIACALWFRVPNRGKALDRRLRLASIVLALTGALIALFSFLFALLEINLARFSSPSIATELPHFAVLDFVLLGLALAFPTSAKHDHVPSVQLLAAGAFVYALFEVLGYAYNPSMRYTAAPMGEGLVLIGLSLGMLFLYPERGFMRDISSSLAGGAMARRLLPVAVVIPVALYWLRYKAQELDVLSPATGTMLMVVMVVILLLYITIATARTLNQADSDRRLKDAELAKANEDLEARVTQRSEELNNANGRLCDELREHKLAEERLLEREERLRLIFEQIPAAVWTTDKQLRVVSVSGAVLAAANVQVERVIGRKVHAFLGTRNRQSTPLAAHLAALEGQHQFYEANLSGRIFAINLQPLRNAGGDINGVIAIALDVTEAKRALASIAKLAAIVESTQDAIYGTTLSGYITSWNRGAERMYGYSAKDVIGQHVSITAPEGQEHELIEVLEKLRQGEVVKPFETVRRCKDGSLVDVSLTVSAVKDSQDRVIGISAIAHDLKDRIEVERELRKLSGRLLKAQDEARRGMARELHDGVVQELVAIVMNLSMLKESKQLAPDSYKALDEALTTTEQAIREIRTFSYLLHPPTLDAMGLQSALRWYVEGYSKRSDLQVELDLPKQLGRMGKEAELALFRVIQEALTNIHRHSGGHRAKIHMCHTPKELILEICDDGHGMNIQTLERVKRESAALGVGIAGMKERIRQLGGQLDLTSSSKGTTVAVRLPNKRKDDEILARSDCGRS